MGLVSAPIMPVGYQNRVRELLQLTLHLYLYLPRGNIQHQNLLLHQPLQEEDGAGIKDIRVTQQHLALVKPKHHRSSHPFWICCNGYLLFWMECFSVSSCRLSIPTLPLSTVTLWNLRFVLTSTTLPGRYDILFHC